MKTIWNGSISFGLVTIPVKLYSAIQAHTFGFRLLHKKCNTPLEFHRWCTRCKKEIAWKDAVKALAEENGSYSVFSQETLETFKPEKSDLISIESFVDSSLIEPIYYEHHFYLAPDAKGIKSFFVLQKALAATHKVAIGKFSMHEKEYVCAIHAYESVLLLSTLHYAYEIRSLKEAIGSIKKTSITKRELDLAHKLINQLTIKTFNIKKYKDEFAEKLKKALRAKKKTQTEKEIHTKEKKTKKQDLVSILQESLRKKRRKEHPVYAKAKK